MELRVDLIFVLLFLLLLAAHILLKPWRAHRIQVKQRKATMLQALDITRMAPIAFEHHCAAVLKTQGWACRTTRTSGDFGVDVVAECQGMRVAIQVKKWQSPVNLSAVQEVAAGAPMYKANVAAVVSVSGYAPSAIRLAQANRVLLLSYDDLFDFTRRVPLARR